MDIDIHFCNFFQSEMSKLFRIFLLILSLLLVLAYAIDAFDDAPNKQICFGDADFDCGAGELRSRCISGFWQCDNVFDCTTGADELHCLYLYNCPSGDFMCHNGDCVRAEFRCNGLPDCLDGTDERGCFGGIGNVRQSFPFQWPKKNPPKSPVHSAPAKYNSAIYIQQEDPQIDASQQFTEQPLKQHEAWFSILSALLALLIFGQVLVLGFVCMRKKRIGRNSLAGKSGLRVNNQPRVRFVPLKQKEDGEEKQQQTPIPSISKADSETMTFGSVHTINEYETMKCRWW